MEELSGKKFGQYTIVEELGAGGMANVYRARQESIGREVAVKVLPLIYSMLDDDLTERFQREVQIIANLQHPHILPVYDYGVQNGQPFIVMALMSGGTLADLVDAGPMSLDDCARYMRQVADALDFAHYRGVIHRDLKPTNVLLDGLPEQPQRNAYLADFGLATMTGANRLTATGAMLGTPAYMAPDWAQSEEAPGISVDVYAMGVMLFEMLTGQLPYEANNPMATMMKHMSEPVPDIRTIRPDVPIDVAIVVMQAMAKNPEERYQTPGDLADALEKAVRRRGDPTLTPLTMPTSQFFYPNTWGRGIFEAAEEVVGKDDLNALLTKAGLERYIDSYPPDNQRKEFPFDHFGKLTGVILEIYGPRGLQSIGRLAGMKSFHNSMDQIGGLARISMAMMRAAGPGRAAWAGLTFQERMFNAMSDQIVQLDETDEHYIWRILRCPICWGQRADTPLGYLAIGVLEAALEWGLGEKFRATETHCIAQGDEAGVFLIDKKPRES